MQWVMLQPDCFEELQTAIRQMGEGTTITFPQGILCGDVLSVCTSPPYVTLESGLLNVLKTNTGALLRTMEYTTAV